MEIMPIRTTFEKHQWYDGPKFNSCKDAVDFILKKNLRMFGGHRPLETGVNCTEAPRNRLPGVFFEAPSDRDAPSDRNASPSVGDGRQFQAKQKK